MSPTSPIPADTVLKLRLEQGFGSDTSRVADRVRARLTEPVRANGRDLLRAGSTVTGYVTTATKAGPVKGRAKVGVRFDGIQPPRAGEGYQMITRPWIAVASATGSRRPRTLAVPASGGAADPPSGKASDAAVRLTARGRDLHVDPGATLEVKLAAPLIVHVGQ